MRYRLLRWIPSVALSAFLPLTGCGILGNVPSTSRLRAQDPRAVITPVEISRDELRAALGSNELTDRVRLVQIFSSSGRDTPEYRIFGIQHGSVYHLLGLEDGDVLYACEGRYLVSGDLFKQYVALLPSLNSASIEYRRASTVVAARYTIR